MNANGLTPLLNPRSVAIIDATDEPHSMGATVMLNLLTAGFRGPIWPVNPQRATVLGLRAYRTISDLPECADLAVICSPAPTIPEVISQLGSAGTRAAIVVGARGEPSCPARVVTDAAKVHGVRVLGPNSLGLLVPGIGLNASRAHAAPAPGTIAFVAQSAAVTTGFVDWARMARVGVSRLVSLGDASDVHFNDLLLALADDPDTRAILLCIESVQNTDAFMTAARAAALHKPVIAIVSGLAQPLEPPSGVFASGEDAYRTALRQAGVILVNTLRELYGAAEIFARVPQIPGPRLAIVSNGKGPAVLATDALARVSGSLARLSPATQNALNAFVPGGRSLTNPVNLVEDAPIPRYLAALEALLAEDGADAVLLIHAPTATAPADAIARACLPVLTRARRPVITCWIGGFGVEEARTRCRDAGIAAFATPEEAVQAFLLAATWHRHQANPNTATARATDPGASWPLKMAQ